ncbi:hypothetical protein CBR_g21020 [Chara braunii]|uniref:Integrase catalytic domain-containing protein n=1 Tax=Chara braunii TaxID=69332 RepID=A0A388L0D8_CHABU|nr:hypothetical protein CBR_g21020 [Chara braunii]|eukprot:GBG75776.1 hypothetical protein CBR_g21020 [Chara braunii]
MCYHQLHDVGHQPEAEGATGTRRRGDPLHVGDINQDLLVGIRNLSVTNGPGAILAVDQPTGSEVDGHRIHSLEGAAVISISALFDLVQIRLLKLVIDSLRALVDSEQQGDPLVVTEEQRHDGIMEHKEQRQESPCPPEGGRLEGRAEGIPKLEVTVQSLVAVQSDATASGPPELRMAEESLEEDEWRACNVHNRRISDQQKHAIVHAFKDSPNLLSMAQMASIRLGSPGSRGYPFLVLVVVGTLSFGFSTRFLAFVLKFTSHDIVTTHSKVLTKTPFEYGMVAFGTAFSIFGCSLTYQRELEKKIAAFLVCYVHILAFMTNYYNYRGDRVAEKPMKRGGTVEGGRHFLTVRTRSDVDEERVDDARLTRARSRRIPHVFQALELGEERCLRRARALAAARETANAAAREQAAAAARAAAMASSAASSAALSGTNGTQLGMPTRSTSNSLGSGQSTSQMAGSQLSPLTPRERELRELQQVERIREQLERDLKKTTDREIEIKNRAARLDTLEADKVELEGLDESALTDQMKTLKKNMLSLHAHVDSRLDFMQSTLDQILDVLTKPGFRPPAQSSLPLSTMSGPFPLQAGTQPSGTFAATAQIVASSSSGPAVVATPPQQPVPQQGQQQGQWYPKTPMKPPLAFSGERKNEELNTWLRTVPVWVKAKRTLPEDEVVTAASYLEGKAAKWLDGVFVKARCGRRMADWAKSLTLDQFMEMVEARWHNPHEAQRATDAINKLDQRKFKSVRALTTTVESLILAPGINYGDQFLLTTFVRCLPENIKNLLASEARLEPEDAKVASIRDWSRPQTVTEVRSFLGMCGYYRNFVKNYSTVASPLTDLTRLDTPWDWSDECEGAFKRLNHALMNHKVLMVPDPQKPFIVTTDASQYGIGAVLAQQDGKKLRPIEYMSKKMPSKKLAKSTYERKLYALYKALVHWRHFLFGRFFYLRTDHQTLKWIKTQPALSDAPKRWIEVIDQYDFKLEYEVIDQYDFKLEYLKGEYNKVADALSRRADYLGALVSDFGVSEEVTHSLVGAYQEDPVMMDIIRKLQAKDKATENEFVMVDGLLYLDKTGIKRLVVPSSEPLRSLFLGEYHDATEHFGYKKTSANLVQRFWWPGMLDDAKKYVETCQVCQRDKPRTQAPLGLLKPLPISPGPRQSVSMDFMDTLVTSKSGKRHIFVIIDRFTKYARLVAMPETTRTDYVIKLFKDNWWLHTAPTIVALLGHTLGFSLAEVCLTALCHMLMILISLASTLTASLKAVKLLMALESTMFFLCITITWLLMGRSFNQITDDIGQRNLSVLQSYMVISWNLLPFINVVFGALLLEADYQMIDWKQDKSEKALTNMEVGTAMEEVLEVHRHKER